VPALSTLHPANDATPETDASGLVVQASVAPLGVVNAKVTELVFPVTVFPPASWTVTTGWVANAVWLALLALGWVVKASLLGVLTTTVLLGALFAVQLL